MTVLPATRSGDGLLQIAASAVAVEAVVRIEGGELRLSTRAAALERAQAAPGKLKAPDESVVDEFLADRRKEAERE